MQIVYLKRLFDRHKLGYTFFEPLDVNKLKETEETFNIRFPTQIYWFYGCCNGYVVPSLPLQIYGLEKLVMNEEGIIECAVIGDQHKIGFKTGAINANGEWDIININTNFLIASTIAALWSNSIFNWVEHQKPFWQ